MRRYHITLSLSLIVVITVVSFSSSLDNGFTNWDDPRYVTENPLIRDLSWKNIKIIFTSFKASNYQPLIFISYLLEYHFFQLDPFIYHLTNLILHIFNTLFLFWVVFIISGKVSVSFISALLFGVHPLHVESVAWISERKDVLSTFFFLQALICYLIYRKSKKTFYYRLSLLTFILSLLSKAMVVTLPVILILFDYLSYRRFDKRSLLDKVPFFILSILFGIVNILAQQSGGALVVETSFAIYYNLLITSKSLVFYLIKTMAPFNLSAHYPYPKVVSILSPAYYLPPILLLVIIVAVFYSRRWTREIVFGSLFFLITILPVIKLIPFGDTVAADRYMYIPSMGLLYMVGLAFHRVYNWGGTYDKGIRLSSILFLGIVVLTFSGLTYQRNNVWQDSETLWVDTVERSPDSNVAHNNLGLAYAEKGLWGQAIAEYKEALRLNPYNTHAHYNLGIAYQKKGLLYEAIAEYKETIRLNHNSASAYYNLGVIYADLGLLNQAVAEYRRALEISPDYADAHLNLGNIYAVKGLFDLAIAELKEALRINPDLKHAQENLKRVMHLKQSQ